ncbi:MAG TPA: glycosyltransferase [Nitrososphaerales archaeon]|nr:glycosyltransferase [Nitrososphaerales archaeon]
MRVLSVFIRSGSDGKAWGSELSYLDLVNELAELGIETDTLEGAPSISNYRPSKSRHYVNTSKGPLPVRLMHQTLDAFRIAKSRSPDVVFVPADYYPGSLLIANLVSIATRRPLFLEFLDQFNVKNDQTPTARLILQSFRGSRSIRSGLFVIVRRLSARRASACFVVTQEMDDYARNVLGARRTVLMGRGVRGAADVLQRVDKLHDGIFVGRLVKRKGLETLVRAWAEVVKTKPDASLVLVGSGDLYPRLRALTSALGLERNLDITGYVNDPSRIRSLLQSSRLFLFPSEVEGFARAVSEAMACGVPCLISDIPNLREIYGKAAAFAAVGDPQEWAKKTISLLDDEGELDLMSTRSVECARGFEWSNSAKIVAVALDDAKRGR